MKYRLLSKEEQVGFEEEFIKFLAVNGIDAPLWEEMKTTQKDKVNTIFESFSDFIFEQILNKIQYLEYFNGKNLMVFKCGSASISMIWLESEDEYPSIQEMLDGLQTNTDKFKISKEEKAYHPDRNTELFKMAESGVKITGNQLYELLQGFVDNGE